MMVVIIAQTIGLLIGTIMLVSVIAVLIIIFNPPK